MNFEEHVAKAKVLVPASIAVPRGKLCNTADEAKTAFGEIGPCVVKAQVPTGKRGKAGGIRKADSAAEAGAAAQAILGMDIDGYRVEKVLVEERAEIAREFYAAVLTDFAARRPLVLFSTEGGMEIEEVAAARPDAATVSRSTRSSTSPPRAPCSPVLGLAMPSRKSPPS
jgi:succinyl-CoA synthetase beta subunit